MIRRDKILRDFLEHPLLKEYGFLSNSGLKISVKEGLSSKYPIVKTIATIINELESNSAISESQLNKIILKILNELV